MANRLTFGNAGFDLRGRVAPNLRDEGAFMNYNLAVPFLESARKYPDKLALFADGRSYSYRQMLDSVGQVASWLTADGGAPKRVGIFGSRSAEACVGILAAAWVGAAYVPISLKQPDYGVLDLLKRSGLDALIADRTGSERLTAKVLDEAPTKLLCAREPQAHRPEPVRGLSCFDRLPGVSEAREPVRMRADDVAYILYTSGSTGVPKGVVLPAAAVDELLNVMEQNYPVSHEDRFAETTDISFDLSVYNMFATWRAGASLHVIPPAQAMAPARLVAEQQITVWLSVPSIAAFMNRMGMLKPGIFQSLRYTFFCGEPLLAKVAKAWQEAAPGSSVVNMYGPTEATVMCIGQEYTEHAPLTRDCVAIGRPFDNMRAAIAGKEIGFAEPGAPGELLLGGPQLALGYLDDPEKTAARFVPIEGTPWYRTGDLAYCDKGGIFHYLGRMDNQVKILGYRVELEEIECHLRDASGCADVAVVGWPVEGGSASGVVGFVVNYQGSIEAVRYALEDRLPRYMVPSTIHVVRQLPLNNNGKVDRGAILRSLGEGKAPK